MTPTRIQRSRKTAYPAGKVLTVTRPSGLGNPYRVERDANGDGWVIERDGRLVARGFSTKREATVYAVDKFRGYLNWLRSEFPAVYASFIDSVRQSDYVACWCPLGSPCHADVWIEFAQVPQ